MSDTLFRYGHFLAIFVMFASVFGQHLLFTGKVTQACWAKAVRLNALFAFSAVLALLFGLSLWWWVGKPPGFYQNNWVFQSKIALFGILVAVALISSQFIWRRARISTSTVLIPRYAIFALRGQLLLMAILPLLGALMANGVGYVR